MGAKSDLIQLGLSVAILAIVLFLSSLFYTKFDLTEEKRHSLKGSTIEMLETLDDIIYVRCYLHGEMNATMRRLAQAVEERLDEFQDYSDGKVDFTFIDPYESGDEETIGKIEQALLEEGLKFTRLVQDDKSSKKYLTVWPGALVTYQGKQLPVQLFASPNPDRTESMVNASINNIEYNLSSAFRLLLKQDRPRIGVLQGHRELDEPSMIDFSSSLEELYFVEDVTIDGQISILSTKMDDMRYRINKYDALIIAKPDSIIPENDKIFIDQFIMNGGKVLWLVDPIVADMDSLRTGMESVGVTNEIGLFEMLFDYGVSMKREMVLDPICAPIKLDAGPMANQRLMPRFNWYYSPLAIPADTGHPIVNNLDPIHFEFAGGLDSAGENYSVKKTVLLKSSEYSKALPAPVRISTAIVDLDPGFFAREEHGGYPMAMLLEGEFDSHYNYRIPDTLKTDPNFAFREKSRTTKMIVIADGDVARNATGESEQGRYPMYPLGYNRFPEQGQPRVEWDNKEFLLNAMNYLLDDDALISVRSRAIELRQLNDAKIELEEFRWKFINVALPIILIMGLGVLQFFMRRRKYGTPS